MANQKLFAGLFTALMLLMSMVAKAQVDFSTTTGYGISASRIMVENIKVGPTGLHTYFNVPFNFDLATLHLIPDLSGATVGTGTSTCSGGGGGTACATLNVTVTNAYNGSVISGATVSAGGVSATTNSSGVATLTNVTSGSVSVSAAASSFTSASQTASDVSCTSANTVAIALSPTTGTGAIPSGAFRTVLTWGANPSDLDSHLTGPTSSTGTSRFHVYYSSRSAGGAALDVDDTSSYGPETTTMSIPSGATSLYPGVYRFSVHHYSGSGNIGTSGANVRLTLPDGSTQSFTPAGLTFPGSKDVWIVYELTVGATGSMTVVPMNSVYNSSSASSVRSYGGDASSAFGSEDMGIFQGTK